jgi:hypothetical protein
MQKVIYLKKRFGEIFPFDEETTKCAFIKMMVIPKFKGLTPIFYAKASLSIRRSIAQKCKVPRKPAGMSRKYIMTSEPLLGIVSPQITINDIYVPEPPEIISIDLICV